MPVSVSCVPRSGPWPQRLRSGFLLASAMTALCLVAPRAGFAQSGPEILEGLPQQIIPLAEEVGLGGYASSTGTVTIAGSGSTGSTGGSGGTGVPAGDSQALETLDSKSWGMQASAYATTLGVDPSAIAATCLVESGCGANTGTRGDVFQMDQSTYNQEIAEALAANPSLAGSIVSGPAGRYDPATESIAAAQYLKDGADYLEARNISDPTNLDVRGYYNFGPSDGAALAAAQDNQLITSVLAHLSPANYKGNGITLGETVGQWRATTSGLLGGTAGEPVLI